MIMITDHCIKKCAESILGNAFSERIAKISDNISNTYQHSWLFCEYENRGNQCERVLGLCSDQEKI